MAAFIFACGSYILLIFCFWGSSKLSSNLANVGVQFRSLILENLACINKISITIDNCCGDKRIEVRKQGWRLFVIHTVVLVSPTRMFSNSFYAFQMPSNEMSGILSYAREQEKSYNSWCLHNKTLSAVNDFKVNGI